MEIQRVEIIEEVTVPQKMGFFDRNKQIFELGFILAIVFVLLILISLFLPNTKPILVPVDEIREITEVEKAGTNGGGVEIIKPDQKPNLE